MIQKKSQIYQFQKKNVNISKVFKKNEEDEEKNEKKNKQNIKYKKNILFSIEIVALVHHVGTCVRRLSM